MDKKRVLTEARKLIEKEENWRGKNVVGHCASTAIHAVGADWKLATEADAALCQAIGLDGNHYSCIWVWNDKPERTHAEVLAAFDKAIVAA